MTDVLGREDTAGIDILRVIHRLGLPLEFPAPVLAEAEEIPDLIDDEEIVRREDWREREVFTVDPEDARDFDDAISVTKLEDGWEVAIHIADVSHYVKPDSELDKEARRRGNSVYPRRPRHTDATGETQQRCLQPQARCGAAHPCCRSPLRQLR